MNPISRFFVRFKFRRISNKDESSNIVDSIVKARKLYKELSLIAHPDKHPLKKAVAEELMQQVTANKRNYSRLVALKAEIEHKLK